jgi:hypothetical protein
MSKLLPPNFMQGFDFSMPAPSAEPVKTDQTKADPPYNRFPPVNNFDYASTGIYREVEDGWTYAVKIVGKRVPQGMIYTAFHSARAPSYDGIGEETTGQTSFFAPDPQPGEES